MSNWTRVSNAVNMGFSSHLDYDKISNWKKDTKEIPMDTTKIGSFLRELRKEKNMTQEQLAEVFQVTNRTVSRWETGNNVPDVGLLMEIADFYEIEVSEILNGERKAPSEETAETDRKKELQEVADFVDQDKEKMALRTRIYAVAGLLAMILYVNLTNFGPADHIGIELLKKFFLFVVYIALSASILYTTDRLQILQRKYKEKLKKKILMVILIVIGGIALFLTLIPFLLIGVAN